MNLPKPDDMFHFSEIHPELRNDLGLLYPLSKKYGKPNEGCYLFIAEYSHFLLESIEDIYNVNYPSYLVLYGGHASSLSTRLHQHCVGKTKWFVSYVNEIDKYDINEGNTLYMPSIYPSILVWYTSSKRERTVLEHKIIGETNPLYNRA